MIELLKWPFLCNHPVISIVVLFFLVTFLWILIKCPFVSIENKHYGARVYHEWLDFAMGMGDIVWTTLTGILFYLIVPFFYVIFLLPKDLLGKNLNKDSFWEEAKKVSFDLRRNYRQY